MLEKELAWIDPLELAQNIAENYNDIGWRKDWIFLYSALNQDVKNSYSYIGIFPDEEIFTDDFLRIETYSLGNKKWFGYLSYEVGREFEKWPKTRQAYTNLTKIHLISFALVFEFNHDEKKLIAHFTNEKYLREVLNYKARKQNTSPARVKEISSNFSDESYLKTIDEIKKMIARGDFYQTNLTRKFFGKFGRSNSQRQNFELFKRLIDKSPANYSAFLKVDGNYIISSSPELFLNVKDKKVLSRPIKGTSPRGATKKQDEKNKINLQNSTKERAENLMIVDLVRNDLSRICKAGSVEVKKLFDVTTYKTIHHMSSEIHGELDKNSSILDAFASCFPPGSMTGAPKIKAMEIIAKEEKMNRGIYSGAIGYISGDEANLSVVIRTLIIQNEKFEFQVGGAITFDSKKESELEEIFNKATGIINLLKIKKALFQTCK